ncbi:MAG TPA: hypothetical protein VK427_01670 [Kofleriaceae bacterium]|nr:hypothetical protein [Kofleriaceae bacterium]
MRSALALVLLVVTTGSLACGPSRQQRALAEQEQFQCKDRLVSYVVSGHLGASELGVQMDCSDGPHIKRWKVDKRGQRLEDDRRMTPGEFDRVWRDVDGTGWPNLKDCASSGGKQDPVYVFDVKDDQNTATFQCQSVTMPYPYNGLVDPLDAAAQQGRRQLGDDEPDELDKKRKK